MQGKKNFVIPYIDQPKSFWDGLFDSYNPFIKEVYFPLHSDIIGSGRPIQPTKYLSDFIKNDAIPKSVLINPIILQQPLKKLSENLISQLNDLVHNYNIVGITVANLSLAILIKTEFPSIEIVASTLMDIFTTQQVLMINGSIDVLVPSSRIVRDINQLREIRTNFHGKIRLIVNESCLPSCVYRSQHFFEMANIKNNYPESLCNDLLSRLPWLSLTGSWILPQHLHFFEDVYDELKIAGRVTLRNHKVYHEVLENYFLQNKTEPFKIGGGPASVPIEINITDDFYEHTLHCNKKCNKCSFCEQYWKFNK